MVRCRRIRLDRLLVERGVAADPAAAQRLIMAGRVVVDGARSDKPGTAVPADAAVDVAEGPKYVSRGGIKLAAALDRFGIDVAGRICADVGASTGGFSDVLLQRGAARVYAIDTAFGELAWRIRSDARVVAVERTNAAELRALPEEVSFVCIDVSLMSLRVIAPAAAAWTGQEADIVALLKPQYEAGPQRLPPGAVITSPQLHREIVTEFLEWLPGRGLFVRGIMRSPITGGGGNAEFLLRLRKADAGAPPGPAEIDALF